CAPAAPDPSSATSSARGRPRTPPLALISSTASSADCTTEGATTEFAPERPTGTPILIGSAASAEPDAATNAREIKRARDIIVSSILVIISQYQPRLTSLPSISS